MSKIVDYLSSLYRRLRGGHRVCTSRRVWSGPITIKPTWGGRYGHHAVREPAEPPDTATLGQMAAVEALMEADRERVDHEYLCSDTYGFQWQGRDGS